MIDEISLIEQLTKELEVYNQLQHPDHIPYLTKLDELETQADITTANIIVIKLLIDIYQQAAALTEDDMANKISEMKESLFETYKIKVKTRVTLFVNDQIINLTAELRKNLLLEYQKKVDQLVIDTIKNILSNDDSNEQCLEKLKTILEKKENEYEEVFAEKKLLNEQMYKNVNLKSEKLQQELISLLQKHLHEACEGGDSDKAFWLLKYNANPLLLNEKGNHPLKVAIDNEHKELAYKILDYITEHNKKSNQSDSIVSKPIYVINPFPANDSKNDSENKVSTSNSYRKLSSIYHIIRTQFYSQVKINLPFTTVINLDNNTVWKLLFQQQGDLLGTPLAYHQIANDAIKKLHDLHKDAARTMEHSSGNTYNSLGLSNTDSSILHAEIKNSFDQLTNSPIVRLMLDGYPHQGGFGNSGYNAALRILINLAKIYSTQCSTVIRFKGLPDGSVLKQESVEVRQLMGVTQYAEPNPEDIIYDGINEEEPSFIIISEYLIKQESSNTGLIRLRKCEIALTKFATEAVKQRLLVLQKMLADKDLFELILEQANIQFDAWPDLSDEQFKKLLIHSPQLEHLNLSNCNQLSSNILESLSKAECDKTLKSLTLKNVSWLKSLSVNGAVIECPQLLSLDVAGCKNLQQILIDAPHLKSLNLSNCNAFNFAISSLNFPKLETINFSFLPQINNETILEFVSAHPYLQRIKLGNPRNINDALYQIFQYENGIDYFIAHCEDVVTTWPKEFRQPFLELLLFIFYSKNRKLPSGLTPLHIAARVGWHDSIDWLLGKDVPLETISAEGKTALDEAIKSNNDSAIKELICNGASICQDTKKTVTAFETYLERTRILSHAERMRLYRLPIYLQASPAGHRLAEPASHQYLLASIRGICLPEKANAIPSKLPDLKATLQVPGSSTLLFLQQQVIEQLIITNPKHKRFGYLREEQNAARKKLGILSNHIVVCVEFNGYYLSLKEKPTHPVMDFAVHLLRMRLSGHGSPPNTLGKLTITYNNKIISYPVLISLTVPGENLNQILQNNNRPIYINRKIFSDLMLFDMTASPGDGSASNYIDQESPESDTMDSIDEDQYFIEPVTKLTRGQRIDSKSILRCLPQAKDAADYSSMQNWTLLSMKALLHEYLQDVDTYQKDCAALFDETEVKRLNTEDKNNLFTPHLLIREGTIAQLLLNTIFIQGQLRVAMLENKPISLIELQTKINFPLGMAHQAALDNNTMTPQQRLVNVTGKSLPSLTSRQSLEACLKEIPTEAELRQPKKFTLKDAMQELELLKNVLLENKILIHNEQKAANDLIVRANFDCFKDSSKQSLLLRILVGYTYTKLEITHSDVLDDNLLEAILSQSQQLTHLDVRYCPRITATAVRFLARHCPNLEVLYLSGTGIQELADQPAELFANQFTAKLAATTLIFSNLKELRIAHCQKLRFIYMDAPELRSLKAKDCPQLDTIITSSQQMTELNLEGCVELTDSALTRIVNDTNKLKNVDLTDCPKILHRTFWQVYPFLIKLASYLLPIGTLKNLIPQFQLDEKTKIKIHENLQQWLRNRDYGVEILFTALKKEKYVEKNVIIKSLGQSGASNAEIYKTLLKMLRESEQRFWKMAAKIYDHLKSNSQSWQGIIFGEIFFSWNQFDITTKRYLKFSPTQDRAATKAFIRFCDFYKFKNHISELNKEIDNNLVIARTLSQLGYAHKPFIVSMFLNLYEVGKIYSGMFTKMDEKITKMNENLTWESELRSIWYRALTLAENKMHKILDDEADILYVKNIRKTINTISLFGLYSLCVGLYKFPDYNYDLLSHNADEDPQTREIRQDYSKLLISLSIGIHSEISSDLYPDPDMVTGFLSEDPTLVLEKLRQLKPPKLIAALWDELNGRRIYTESDEAILGALIYLEQLTPENIADYVKKSHPHSWAFNNSYIRVTRRYEKKWELLVQVSPIAVKLMLNDAKENDLTNKSASTVCRTVAAYVLGRVKIASKEVVETLVTLSNDSEWRVRINAILSLQTLNQSLPEEIITSLIEDLSKEFKQFFSNRTTLYSDRDHKEPFELYYDYLQAIERLSRFKFGAKHIIKLLLRTLQILGVYRYSSGDLLNAIVIALDKLGYDVIRASKTLSVIHQSTVAIGQQPSMELLTNLRTLLHGLDSAFDVFGQLLQPASLEKFLKKNIPANSADPTDTINNQGPKEKQDKTIVSDKPQSFFYNEDDNNNALPSIESSKDDIIDDITEHRQEF